MNENNALSDQYWVRNIKKLLLEEGIALQVRHIEHSGVYIYINIYTHTHNFFFFFHKCIHL